MDECPLPLNSPTDWVQCNVGYSESAVNGSFRRVIPPNTRTHARVQQRQLKWHTDEVVSTSIKGVELDTIVRCLGIRKDWHARIVGANRANGLYSQIGVQKHRIILDHSQPSSDLIRRGCLSDIEPDLGESYPQVATRMIVLVGY
ncbi:MAG TPA: hypothetical protein VK574_12690 [Terracidiphilus sp.]|nr:hypothetical protein [Terracidiphilus sp.]